MPSRRRALPGSVLPIAALLIAALAACGDDDGVASAPSDDQHAVEGQQVFESRGCASCHSTAGASGTGPPLDGIYGEEVELADGTTLTRDDEYLEEAIRNPASAVVSGYQPVMPTFSLDDDELEALVAYIRALSD